MGTHDLSTFITHYSRVLPVTAEQQEIYDHKFRSANGLSSLFFSETQIPRQQVQNINWP